MVPTTPAYDVGLRCNLLVNLDTGSAFGALVNSLRLAGTRVLSRDIHSVVPAGNKLATTWFEVASTDRGGYFVDRWRIDSSVRSIRIQRGDDCAIAIELVTLCSNR